MQISDEMVEAFGNAFWSVNAASKIDGQREHIRSALEAALSTDAKPFGWTSKHFNEGEEHRKWGLRRENVASYEGYVVQALYAEPVKTAPSVAVKALQDAYSAGFAASSQGYNGEIFPDFESDNEWLGTRNGELSEIHGALSAQVQDVPPIKAFAEWLNNGPEIAKAAGNVIDVRVTTPCGNKLRLTGGASPSSKHGDAE